MSGAGNPVDRFHIVIEQLKAIGDDENAAWLAHAIAEYLRGETPLGDSLGLTGKLGRSPRYAYLRRQRDQHLRDALWALDGNLSRLADEISKYERIPYLRRQKQDPFWSAARIAIHQASLVGIVLPATRKGLRQTLNWVEPEPGIPAS